jgi:hypothetical protein
MRLFERVIRNLHRARHGEPPLGDGPQVTIASPALAAAVARKKAGTVAEREDRLVHPDDGFERRPPRRLVELGL